MRYMSSFVDISSDAVLPKPNRRRTRTVFKNMIGSPLMSGTWAPKSRMDAGLEMIVDVTGHQSANYDDDKKDPFDRCS